MIKVFKCTNYRLNYLDVLQVDVACSAYHQEHAMDIDSDNDDDAIVQGVSPKEVCMSI